MVQNVSIPVLLAEFFCLAVLYTFKQISNDTSREAVYRNEQSLNVLSISDQLLKSYFFSKFVIFIVVLDIYLISTRLVHICTFSFVSIAFVSI